jgi:hypothetical protein
LITKIKKAFDELILWIGRSGNRCSFLARKRWLPLISTAIKQYSSELNRSVRRRLRGRWRSAIQLMILRSEGHRKSGGWSGDVSDPGGQFHQRWPSEASSPDRGRRNGWNRAQADPAGSHSRPMKQRSTLRASD